MCVCVCVCVWHFTYDTTDPSSVFDFGKQLICLVCSSVSDSNLLLLFADKGLFLPPLDKEGDKSSSQSSRVSNGVLCERVAGATGFFS